MSNFNTLFEPNYTVLTFLMVKTFFYVELIGFLALLRVFLARGPSRWVALGAFSLAFIGFCAKYIPPLAGLTGTETGRIAARVINQGLFDANSGMALPVAVSLLFAWSWRLKGRRWWVLDVLHLIAALGFFGLWIYTRL